MQIRDYVQQRQFWARWIRASCPSTNKQWKAEANDAMNPASDISPLLPGGHPSPALHQIHFVTLRSLTCLEPLLD